jgi:hypothetical protein
MRLKLWLGLSSFALCLIAPSPGEAQAFDSNMVITCEVATCQHRWLQGNDFIILHSDDASVAVAVDHESFDPKKFISLTVAVSNTGDHPIDVVPSEAWIGVDTPKKDRLPYVQPETVAKEVRDYSTVMKLAMKANTIDKGQNNVGTIFFKANKKAHSARLILTVGLHIFLVPITLAEAR